MSEQQKWSAAQEFLDEHYWRTGQCCAGCDWWHFITPRKGECHVSKIVPGEERLMSLGIDSCSATVSSGHAITDYDHRCANFKDAFDWTSLPLPYRKRVGAPT